MSLYIARILFYLGVVFVIPPPLARAYTLEQADHIAEQTFLAVARTLDMYTESCIFFRGECGLTGNYGYVLRTVKLEMLNYHMPQINFDTERDHPGAFFIDGQIRVAKTGSRPGDPITINRDMIVEPNIFGGFNPLSVPQVAAILVHEIGHHYERFAAELGFPTGVITQHEQLDTLGSLVATFIEHRSQRAFVGEEVHPILGHDSGITFENFIEEAGSGDGDYNYGSQSRTFVRGPFGFVDVTSSIARLTRCPLITIGDLTRQGSPFNLYFESFEKAFARLSGTQLQVRIQFIGSAVLNCASDALDSFTGFRNGVLDLYFLLTDGTVTFDSTQMRLNIDVPPDQHWQSRP